MGIPNVLAFRTAGDLLSRMMLGARAGLTFSGKRNVAEALGYKPSLVFEDYNRRFKRGGIAKRIVQVYPRATWRGVGELIEDEDPRVDTAFESAWHELSTRLSVWTQLRRADVLAGIGRYAVLFIGAPGDDVTQPLARLSADEVMYLQPFSEGNARIERYDDDVRSPRYGQPTAYQLTAGVDRRVKSFEVHWTRCVHIADELTDDNVHGTPRMEAVWNYLDDLDKVVGGGSEAFWLRAHQGYHFDLDKEMELDAKDEKKFANEVDEFVNGLRRTVKTRGVSIDTLGSDVADFSTQSAAIISLIAGTIGIPQRILLGSERGELASSQDRDTWREQVQDRRTEVAGPSMLRPLVDRLIEFGALPTPVNGYEVRWPEVFEVTQGERVQNARVYAEINRAAGETVVSVDEIRDHALGLPPLDEVLGDVDEDVEEEDQDAL